jgi:pyruvate,water dikinase
MPTMSTLIMGFGAGAPGTAALAECGGKAVNLVRLAAAGLPVPPGFVVTTSAYHAFVAANDLATAISSALTALDPDHPDADALEAASASIRAAFRAGTVPGEITDAILAELAERPEVPLAVRSSATAEDLPELSFAGQQDTYLNVVGVQAVMAAIVDCWSSLWTARAIGYRMRAGIEHADTALAVVVQEMVEADSSGVMFTADPVDGRRDRVVIDATYGLGEALVSGQVEPDHYVVADGGVVVERTAGAKAVATVPRPGGGVDTVARTGDSFALTDVQLIELAAVGRRIEELYESPQDIEWAYAHGHLHVLQSRAVTSLYPLPDPAAGPGEAVWDGFPAWLSFGSFQGMLDPITPLGRDAIMLLARGLVRLFGGTPGSGRRSCRCSSAWPTQRPAPSSHRSTSLGSSRAPRPPRPAASSPRRSGSSAPSRPRPPGWSAIRSRCGYGSTRRAIAWCTTPTSASDSPPPGPSANHGSAPGWTRCSVPWRRCSRCCSGTSGRSWVRAR